MARLRWFYGPMSSGKSTLALQQAYNYRTAGRHVLLLTKADRAGSGVICSRLGISADAIEVADETDLLALVGAQLPDGGVVIADEAQFYAATQIEQLARVVDELGVDVDTFGILTDFATHLFPGSARLVELADEMHRLQAEVRCHCGALGQANARLVDDVVVHDGAQVVVGDVRTGATVRYQVLCRRHWRDKDAG